MRARDNPFSVDRIHAIRYRPLDTTFDEILLRLRELNHRAAIVGPDGSGKTTLLEDLQQALQRKSLKTRMVFVNDTSPFDAPTCRRLLSEMSRDEVLLFDGADLISRACWSLLKRHTITHALGLIITSHRSGLLPTLIDCATTPALLKEIVNELQPPDHPIAADLLDRLYQRHQGNLRTCLRDLYDRYAGGYAR